MECTPVLQCCKDALPQASPHPDSPSFGLQIWPAGLLQSPDVVQKLLALHPARLRFSVGPSWGKEPALNLDETDASLDAYVAAAYDRVPNIGDTIQRLLDIKTRSGAGFDLVVWTPPLIGNEPPGQRWRSLAHHDIQTVARFQLANLRHLKRLGLPIEAVELFNEPDGNWAIRISPADYAQILSELRREASAQHFGLPLILGPGVSTATNSREYLGSGRAASDIARSVDVISLHTWDDKMGLDHYRSLDAFLRAIDPLSPRRSVWITEFGLTRPFPGNTSPAADTSKRAPNSVAMTQLYGVLSARDLLRAYATGVGPVIYWEFQDQSWEDSLHGLLNVDGSPKPVYHVIRQVTDQIAALRPNSIELDKEQTSAVLHGQRQSYLFAWNTTEKPFYLLLPPGNAAVESMPSPAVAPSGHDTPCQSLDGAHALFVPSESLAGIPLAR
jgi:Glycosyl hydrolase catalytic core